MDNIKIIDLELFLQVGISEDERAKPQRLLVSLNLEHDFAHAIAADNLADTIDYHALSQRLFSFGKDRHWQLIETLAADIASMVIDEFRARSVTVEVKKFVIPRAAYVSVTLTRSRP